MFRGCFLLFLAVLGFTNSFGQWFDWDAKSNYSERDFSQNVQDMKVRGYAPLKLNVISINGEPRYSCIWSKRNAKDWACWHRMNQEHFIKKIKEFESSGLSPVDITVWNSNGTTLYGGVWLKTGYNSTLLYGVSGSELNTHLRSFGQNGYTPIDIDGYVVNGASYFTVIFSKEPFGEWKSIHGYSEAEYNMEANRLAKLGFVLKDVNYFTNGTVKCNAIWVKKDAIWESRMGLDHNDLKNFAEQKAQEGYLATDIDQYYDNGNVLYGITMVKLKSQDVPRTPSVSNNIPSTNQNQAMTRSKVLPITPVLQQTDVWCWLANGEMIFTHLGIPNQNPGGNYQCGIIGTISPSNSPCRTQCFTPGTCIIPSGSNANTVRMLKDYTWLVKHRVFQCSEGQELSANTIKANIDNNQPILCGVSPNRRQYYFGAEHVALLIGYTQTTNDFFLTINDPFPYNNNDNPYFRAGATMLRNFQYKISLRNFAQNIFWHWSVYNISL